MEPVSRYERSVLLKQSTLMPAPSCQPDSLSHGVSLLPSRHMQHGCFDSNYMRVNELAVHVQSKHIDVTFSCVAVDESCHTGAPGKIAKWTLLCCSGDGESLVTALPPGKGIYDLEQDDAEKVESPTRKDEEQDRDRKMTGFATAVGNGIFWVLPFVMYFVPITLVGFSLYDNGNLTEDLRRYAVYADAHSPANPELAYMHAVDRSHACALLHWRNLSLCTQGESVINQMLLLCHILTDSAHEAFAWALWWLSSHVLNLHSEHTMTPGTQNMSKFLTHCILPSLQLQVAVLVLFLQFSGGWWLLQPAHPLHQQPPLAFLR